ncbi:MULTISPECIES: Pecanex-like protein 1 [Pseudonocardia]|uniref:Pecanex-like protein 1 n=2 Tax=Pseudonocardia TaxID=1847 RepID=A0A1Y2N3Q5_PSEAH|nr:MULTISPECIES: Pecanex-like protein 1 [Pseudonocardia]OSY42080.1 hypothetical protein BG845_01576 [Pseudonocardia autotrophica]TDN75151.1 hypothetical protein C8E95_4295 [Pseudonocardia autotrophica]BBF99096.1 hypothetical protein Pdca_03060 [Pseudonocardia autotrophica]GEC24016.1 hypothetical protein PSA01_10450 [Pseudonocardia saturnea]
MSPSTTNRRRVAAAAAFVACLLVAGPAAYAAGAATADRDGPAAENIAESLTGTGLTGSGSGSGSTSGGHDHGTSSSPGQGSGTEDDSDGTGGSGTDGTDGSDGSGSGDAPAEGQDQAPDGQDDGNGQDDDAGNNDGPDQDAAEALEILASDCSASRLTPHNGFQEAPRCVGTAFGEVADAERSPSLLITEAPDQVAPGEAFSLTVSTRNLVRDRFLPAAQGGYYVESSLLDGQGLQRGHFHTACRILSNPAEAPDSAPDPLFFEATEDGGGGDTPDSVTIEVPGFDQAGELQCSSWAGDGSHRTPMMQRANQTPAFDSVRIEVG